MEFQRRGHHISWPIGRIPVVIAAIVVILILTLFPYTFHFGTGSVDQGRLLHPSTAQLDMTVGLADFVRNCLLFFPLGLILTAALARDTVRFSNGAWAVLACLLLSGLIEFLQTGLHSRTPAASDVVANTLGGLLGGVLGLRCPNLVVGLLRGLGELLSRACQTRVVLSLLLIHVVVAGIFVSQANRQSSLTNWDPTYHLMLGNEATGDRPWRGQLVRVEMRVDDQLVLGFPGPAENPLQPAGDQGISLQWVNGEGTETVGPSGVRLDGVSWLESPQPATALNRTLQRANRFTLEMTVAVADTMQKGPARILSLSQDTWHRNLTLGQEGSSLVVRLRTPFSGDNGTYPALVVDDFFAAGYQQLIRVAYDGRRLVVRSDHDRILGRLEFRYGAALCMRVFHFDYYDQAGYRLAYLAVLVLPPLALVLWWVWGRRGPRSRKNGPAEM